MTDSTTSPPRRRVGAAGLGGSTTAPTSGRGRHRRQGTAPDRGEPAVPHPGPCVCVTGQPCLLHYDRMNQREQARILARLGVRP